MSETCESEVLGVRFALDPSIKRNLRAHVIEGQERNLEFVRQRLNAQKDSARDSSVMSGEIRGAISAAVVHEREEFLSELLKQAIRTENSIPALCTPTDELYVPQTEKPQRVHHVFYPRMTLMTQAALSNAPKCLTRLCTESVTLFPQISDADERSRRAKQCRQAVGEVSEIQPVRPLYRSTARAGDHNSPCICGSPLSAACLALFPESVAILLKYKASLTVRTAMRTVNTLHSGTGTQAEETKAAGGGRGGDSGTAAAKRDNKNAAVSLRFRKEWERLSVVELALKGLATPQKDLFLGYEDSRTSEELEAACVEILSMLLADAKQKNVRLKDLLESSAGGSRTGQGQEKERERETDEDAVGASVLHRAVRTGKLKVVKLLVETLEKDEGEGPALLEQMCGKKGGEKGETPLDLVNGLLRREKDKESEAARDLRQMVKLLSASARKGSAPLHGGKGDGGKDGHGGTHLTNGTGHSGAHAETCVGEGDGPQETLSELSESVGGGGHTEREHGHGHHPREKQGGASNRNFDEEEDETAKDAKKAGDDLLRELEQEEREMAEKKEKKRNKKENQKRKKKTNTKKDSNAAAGGVGGDKEEKDDDGAVAHEGAESHLGDSSGIPGAQAEETERDGAAPSIRSPLPSPPTNARVPRESFGREQPDATAAPAALSSSQPKGKGERGRSASRGKDNVTRGKGGRERGASGESHHPTNNSTSKEPQSQAHVASRRGETDLNGNKTAEADEGEEERMPSDTGSDRGDAEEESEAAVGFWASLAGSASGTEDHEIVSRDFSVLLPAESEGGGGVLLKYSELQKLCSAAAASGGHDEEERNGKAGAATKKQSERLHNDLLEIESVDELIKVGETIAEKESGDKETPKTDEETSTGESTPVPLLCLSLETMKKKDFTKKVVEALDGLKSKARLEEEKCDTRLKNLRKQRDTQQTSLRALDQALERNEADAKKKKEDAAAQQEKLHEQQKEHQRLEALLKAERARADTLAAELSKAEVQHREAVEKMERALMEQGEAQSELEDAKKKEKEKPAAGEGENKGEKGKVPETKAPGEADGMLQVPSEDTGAEEDEEDEAENDEGLAALENEVRKTIEKIALPSGSSQGFPLHDSIGSRSTATALTSAEGEGSADDGESAITKSPAAIRRERLLRIQSLLVLLDLATADRTRLLELWKELEEEKAKGRAVMDGEGDGKLEEQKKSKAGADSSGGGKRHQQEQEGASGEETAGLDLQFREVTDDLEKLEKLLDENRVAQFEINQQAYGSGDANLEGFDGCVFDLAGKEEPADWDTVRETARSLFDRQAAATHAPSEAPSSPVAGIGGKAGGGGGGNNSNSSSVKTHASSVPDIPSLAAVLRGEEPSTSLYSKGKEALTIQSQTLLTLRSALSQAGRQALNGSNRGVPETWRPIKPEDCAKIASKAALLLKEELLKDMRGGGGSVDSAGGFSLQKDFLDRVARAGEKKVDLGARASISSGIPEVAGAEGDEGGGIETELWWGARYEEFVAELAVLAGCRIAVSDMVKEIGFFRLAALRGDGDGDGLLRGVTLDMFRHGQSSLIEALEKVREALDSKSRAKSLSSSVNAPKGGGGGGAGGGQGKEQQPLGNGSFPPGAGNNRGGKGGRGQPGGGAELDPPQPFTQRPRGGKGRGAKHS